MTQSTQRNQNKDRKKCSQGFRTFYFFRLNASTDQSGSCARQNLNPSAKIQKSARELSAIHWAFTGDCGRLNYTAQTPLLWFFCNLLCCINFWFAVQIVGLLVEYIQKSTGNRVNSPCDITAMRAICVKFSHNARIESKQLALYYTQAFCLRCARCMRCVWLETMLSTDRDLKWVTTHVYKINSKLKLRSEVWSPLTTPGLESSKLYNPSGLSTRRRRGCTSAGYVLLPASRVSNTKIHYKLDNIYSQNLTVTSSSFYLCSKIKDNIPMLPIVINSFFKYLSVIGCYHPIRQAIPLGTGRNAEHRNAECGAGMPNPGMPNPQRWNAEFVKCIKRHSV